MRIKLCLAVLLFAAPAVAQEETGEYAMHVVGNGELAAQLVVNDASERITGRTSFHFIADGDEITVRALNLAFFGVSQKPIAGTIEPADPLGVLAFAVTSGKSQTLRYDRETKRISGALQMFADASFLNALAAPRGDAADDVQATPVLPAGATVTIEMDFDLADPLKAPRSAAMRFEFELQTDPSELESFKVPPFVARSFGATPVDIALGELPFFEVGRRLCIQPVFLVKITPLSLFEFPLLEFSGAGFDFGRPGADREWGKADVVFEYRQPRVLHENGHWVVDVVRMLELMDRVDVDDCIEVFFPHGFEPRDEFGGGVTFGLGVAGVKVVTSDENARLGIDLTHLGHEFGHVLGLLHPSPLLPEHGIPGSSGTLMCPMGLGNDNPRVNSEDNKDALFNPLLTFTLKVITPGPDCQSSSDCGPCP